ncbi:MAG: hypothetical protein ACQEQV_02460 [Fibrobacterota bacterium]
MRFCVVLLLFALAACSNRQQGDVPAKVSSLSLQLSIPGGFSTRSLPAGVDSVRHGTLVVAPCTSWTDTTTQMQLVLSELRPDGADTAQILMFSDSLISRFGSESLVESRRYTVAPYAVRQINVVDTAAGIAVFKVLFMSGETQSFMMDFALPAQQYSSAAAQAMTGIITSVTALE